MTRPIDMQDKYFDLKTLSEYSSLSVSTLRSYLYDPDNPIPSYCLKRKILIRQSEFDRWIKQHKAESNQLSAIVDEVISDLIADRKTI